VSLDAQALGERIRELSPAVAVQITEEFLTRHPDWQMRFGARAMTAGVQDAGYHLAFLAAALDSRDPVSFATYARWAATVLEARGIDATFLAENLEQMLAALSAQLRPAQSATVKEYIETAIGALRQGTHPPPAGTLSLTAQVYLQAALDGQRHAAVQIAREALREGTTLSDFYLDVLQPVLYEVGARWEANRLTVAQEHMATAITQYVMAQVYDPRVPEGEGRGRLILTGVEGELHSVGAVMVGDLLEMAGWHVRFLGTNLPATSVLASIREWRPTHVGISTTMVFHLAAVRHLIGGIRREFADRVAVVLGGAAYRVQPDAWKDLGGDAYAADLRAVQQLLAGTP
jgi:methanogenic corrinoid protein MtbC1